MGMTISADKLERESTRGGGDQRRALGSDRTEKLYHTISRLQCVRLGHVSKNVSIRDVAQSLPG
jgi:hypothetical protein